MVKALNGNGWRVQRDRLPTHEDALNLADAIAGMVDALEEILRLAAIHERKGTAMLKPALRAIEAKAVIALARIPRRG